MRQVRSDLMRLPRMQRYLRQTHSFHRFQHLIFRDDLFPTTTTMQFGGKDRSYIYEDLNERESVAEDEEEASYKINTKGKIMIAVYALVVLTIFTLIIMNTRLIKNMNASISEQEARIEALMEENQELMNEYEFVQSDEEVIRRAEEMGMVVNG